MSDRHHHLFCTAGPAQESGMRRAAPRRDENGGCRPTPKPSTFYVGRYQRRGGERRRGRLLKDERGQASPSRTPSVQLSAMLCEPVELRFTFLRPPACAVVPVEQRPTGLLQRLAGEVHKGELVAGA